MKTLLAAMLFVPGGDERKLAKIGELKAPAFILDLEDAVADSAKSAARSAVAQVISSQPTQTPLFVRVNASTPDALYADLRQTVQVGLTGVVIPKVSSRSTIEIVDWLLGVFERELGITESISIMPTIESVEGLANVDEIAVASPRNQCLIFGAGDFSLDVGLDWPPPNGDLSPVLIQAKSKLVLSSRAAGLQPPHDGVYPMFRDDEGLRRESAQSRSIGMFGKHAVHPGQVLIIESVFMPGEQQLNRAREIVEAFEASESRGVGNIDVGGQFIDYPVAARARQLLLLAEQLEQRAE
jgi:citrate lyase beta subunit